MKGASPQVNYYDAVGLYNECLLFLPELEAVVAKLEAALLEIVQVFYIKASGITTKKGLHGRPLTFL